MAGDANHDGKVDVSDLGVLAAHYGQTSGVLWETGDFNADGRVDVGDLGILAANYGQDAGGETDFAADADTLGSCRTQGLLLVSGLLLFNLWLCPVVRRTAAPGCRLFDRSEESAEGG